MHCPTAFLVFAILAICAAGQEGQSQESPPPPRSDQGPFVLVDAKGLCMEGTPNMAAVNRKKCSKSNSYQKFYYSPNIGAFKLGNKCLGIGTIGGLQLVRCPEAAYQNYKAMWSCQGTECCVAANGNYCVTVKDAGMLTSWLPDIDLGSSNGIWKMVLYFIMLTLAFEVILCLVKLLISILKFLLGLLKKPEVGPEVEVGNGGETTTLVGGTRV